MIRQSEKITRELQKRTRLACKPRPDHWRENRCSHSAPALNSKESIEKVLCLKGLSECVINGGDILVKENLNVKFDGFTALTMKNVVFWAVVPCTSSVNRFFGGTYSLYLQPSAYSGFSLTDFFTLKMKAICSSETSVHRRCTRQHVPEDGILRKNTVLRVKKNFRYGNFGFHLKLIYNT
jgi:hypothetical protein